MFEFKQACSQILNAKLNPTSLNTTHTGFFQLPLQVHRSILASLERMTQPCPGSAVLAVKQEVLSVVVQMVLGSDAARMVTQPYSVSLATSMVIWDARPLVLQVHVNIEKKTKVLKILPQSSSIANSKCGGSSVINHNHSKCNIFSNILCVQCKRLSCATLHRGKQDLHAQPFGWVPGKLKKQLLIRHRYNYYSFITALHQDQNCENPELT